MTTTTELASDVDDRAFAELLQRHRSELVGHCTRFLRSRERAEDAAQEALLKAWRARRTFSGHAPFGAWLRRIATNTCLTEIRRGSSPTRRGVPLAPLDPPAPAAAVPEAVLDAHQALEEAFRAVMAVLPPRQRAVLVLRGVLDLSAAETAACLGMTVSAVNSALQRARAALRATPPALPRGGDIAALRGYVDALAGDDAARVVATARTDLATSPDEDGTAQPGSGVRSIAWSITVRSLASSSSASLQVRAPVATPWRSSSASVRASPVDQV